MNSNKLLILAGVIIIVIVAGTALILSNSNALKSTNTTINSNTNSNIPTNSSFQNIILSNESNITILGIKNIDTILKGSWSFTNKNVEIPNTSSGIKKISIYNFTNNTGYSLNIFIVSFNNTESASNEFNLEASSARNSPNVTYTFGALNSQYGYGIFSGNIPSTTGTKTINVGVGQYKNYLIDLQLLPTTTQTIQFNNIVKKLYTVLNEMEPIPKNISILNSSTTTTAKLKNIFGSNWIFTKNSTITLNTTTPITLELENYSSTLGYNLSVGKITFKNASNAIKSFNSGLLSFKNTTGITVVNGDLSNGHSVFIVGGSIYNNNNKRIVSAGSIFGNYVLEVNMYLSNNSIINENITSPGMIDLLNNLENAPLLAPNSTTNLLNQSNSLSSKIPSVSNKQLFINTTTVDSILGNSWKFLNTTNITSNLPQYAKWFAVENFNNLLGQDFVVQVGEFYNASDAALLYNTGANALFGANILNLTVSSFHGGLAYSNLSVISFNSNANTFKKFLGYIAPDGNYIIELSLSENTINYSSLNNYQPLLKNVLENVYLTLHNSSIQSLRLSYPTTQELKNIFNGSWTALPVSTFQLSGLKGEKAVTIKNFTSTTGYNISVIIATMNNTIYADNAYKTTTMNSLLNKQKTIFGAFNTDYAYTTSNASISNNVSIIKSFGAYGDNLTIVSLYTNKNKSLTNGTLDSLITKVLQSMETS